MSNICIACKEEIIPEELTTHTGYWFPKKHSIHKTCAKEYKQIEAYECQKIDADCNDCFYLKRQKIEDIMTKWHQDMGVFMYDNTDISKPKLLKEGEHTIFPATCTKYNKGVIPKGNHHSGYKCFKHRKDE